jgi:hypothetical protein
MDTPVGYCWYAKNESDGSHSGDKEKSAPRPSFQGRRKYNAPLLSREVALRRAMTGIAKLPISLFRLNFPVRWVCGLDALYRVRKRMSWSFAHDFAIGRQMA